MGEPEDRGLQAILREYEFVSSLIPTYRSFQNQAVGFVVIIYVAILGLIGSALASGGSTNILTKITEASMALVPWPVEIAVIAFFLYDIRIRRASRYIQCEIYPKVDKLTNTNDFLKWELSPGAHMSWAGRLMTTSFLLIAFMALPALLLSGFYLWGVYVGDVPEVQLSLAKQDGSPYMLIPPELHPIGFGILLTTVVLAVATSYTHEMRTMPVPECVLVLLKLGTLKRVKQVKNKNESVKEYLSRAVQRAVEEDES